MQNNGQGSIIIWPAVPADWWCGALVFIIRSCEAKYAS